MKCPFCHNRLFQQLHYSTYTSYICLDMDCLQDGMARYQLLYNNYPTFLIGRIFMLGKYYIQLHYQNNTTTISILEVCILKDTIVINNIIPLNLKDIPASIEKIKTLMVFS